MDGLALTKDENTNDKKKFYGSYEEVQQKGFCDLQLCSLDHYEAKPGQRETNGSEAIIPACKKDGACMSMWTAWSEWGKCNKDFGDGGNRNRTRWFILIIANTNKFLTKGPWKACVKKLR